MGFVYLQGLLTYFTVTAFCPGYEVLVNVSTFD